MSSIFLCRLFILSKLHLILLCFQKSQLCVFHVKRKLNNCFCFFDFFIIYKRVIVFSLLGYDKHLIYISKSLKNFLTLSKTLIYVFKSQISSCFFRIFIFFLCTKNRWNILCWIAFRRTFGQ